MRSRTKLVIGSVATTLAVLLYLVAPVAPTLRTPAIAADPAGARHTATALPELPAPADPDPVVAPAPVAPASNPQPGIESVDRARRSLEIYKATMVFPPWSRPLDGSTRHLLEWNKPWPIGQPFAADKDRREIRVDASLDKLFAGAGEPFTATVSVTYEQPPNVPVSPDQLIGHVRYLDGDWKVAAEVAFSRSGDRYVASFTPSAIPALAAKPREVQFLIHVQMGELFPKDLAIPFQYAAENAFAVTGLAADRTTSDGSLEVALDVEVKLVAPTLIQAVLFDADGKRGIATYSDYFRPTATGRQEAAIKFYGKSIYDSHVSGRYRIVALNGHVKVPGATPHEVFWTRTDQLPPLVTTNAYSSSQFTREAWASPDKDAKIKQYEDLIRDLGSRP